MCDAKRLGAPDFAIIRYRSACNDPQQRGLACAVTPDQTNPFPRIDLKVDVREQRQVAVSQRDTIQAKQRHEDANSSNSKSGKNKSPC
jgi:hypothetical protein